jgi:GT2 family glycosyltransferase
MARMTDHGAPGDRPVVSALIVNYRSTDLLQGCLTALARSTVAPSIQVVVVDNATPGFDPAALDVSGLHVRFLTQDHNTTFTGGNDIAFGESQGRFILLLNPDTRVEPGAIECAIEHLETDPGLVALGAYFLDEHGELRPYYRRLPRVRDIPVILIPRLLDWTPMARRYRMADETFEGPTVVEQPSGAFILLRREAAPSPLLDRRYFNFFSDVELCRSLGRTGEIRVEPDVRCFHARGGAGLITDDPAARSRLHHDLVWGVRYYFRRAGAIERTWLQLWVTAFWLLRLSQGLLRGRAALRTTWTAARASFAGAPPDYSEDATMEP